jgi:hypothetical protein
MIKNGDIVYLASNNKILKVKVNHILCEYEDDKLKRTSYMLNIGNSKLDFSCDSDNLYESFEDACKKVIKESIKFDGFDAGEVENLHDNLFNTFKFTKMKELL